MAQQVKKITPADIVICIFVIAVSLLLSFVLSGGEGGRIAVVEIDGKEYARYDLDRVSAFEEKIITDSGYNNIRVSREGVKVISADCANQIDVKRGIISRSGESIVCLPHKLVIYIEGANAEADSVSY